jgi:hypothetical protein
VSALLVHGSCAIIVVSVSVLFDVHILLHDCTVESILNALGASFI